jgi:L-ribulokinase
VSQPTYALGVDFGTESGRALLLDLRTGEEAAVSEVAYAHGAIDRTLPATGEQLPPDWALQDPDDWVAVLDTAIPAVLEAVGGAREGCRCARSAPGASTSTPGRSSGSTTRRSRSPTASTT